MSLPAAAQRVAAPPSEDPDKGKQKEPRDPDQRHRRKAPTPEPSMPVRKPSEVSGFEPASGSPNSDVVLRGANFDDTCKVRFNGRELKVLERSDSSLRVRIPPNAVTDKFVVEKAGFREVVLENAFLVVRPPQIRTFQPRQAGIGDQVTVFGQHFLPDDQFKMGEAEMPRASYKPDVVVLTVPEAALVNPITLVRGGKVIARTRDALDLVRGAPVISGFSPDRGSPGTTVRITGSNFEPGDRVLLSGKPLKVRDHSVDAIEVVIGPRDSTGQLTLDGRNGRRAVSEALFTVVRPPSVQGFTPGYGSPGTVITVTGIGFLEGDQVALGEAILTTRSASHDRITAEVPPGVETGPIAIKRGDRRFPARGRFEVIQAPGLTNFSPTAGPAGTRVTLSGRHFLDDAQVMLSGQKLKIVGRTLPTELVVEIPEGARTGNLVVVTRAGSARSEITFEVNQVALVSSFFPLHGLPGTRVTLRGDHFHKGIRVLLGGVQLTVARLEPMELEVEIPDNAPSGKFELDSFGRRVQSAMDFTVDQPRAEIEFSFAPKRGRRGSEVTLTIDPPHQEVLILFDERPLPKKTLREGRQVVVTIPSDAPRKAFFEVEFNGRRYKAAEPFLAF